MYEVIRETGGEFGGRKVFNGAPVGAVPSGVSERAFGGAASGEFCRADSLLFFVWDGGIAVTVVGVHVRTNINVVARANVYSANEIVRIFYEVVSDVGLNVTELAEIQPTIEKGLRAWLAMRKLEAAYLEVFDPMTQVVRCRTDLNIVYTSETNERHRTDINRVKTATSSLGRYPGCKYRVVVSLADGAPDVEGWDTTTLGSVDHLAQRDVGDVIDTVAVRSRMFTWS